MKIAVSSTGNSKESLLSSQFGRCPYFAIYDTENLKYEIITNNAHDLPNGAGPKAVECIATIGAEVIITGHVGDKAEAALNSAKIKMETGYKNDITIEEAVSQYLNK